MSNSQRTRVPKELRDQFRQQVLANRKLGRMDIVATPKVRDLLVQMFPTDEAADRFYASYVSQLFASERQPNGNRAYIGQAMLWPADTDIDFGQKPTGYFTADEVRENANFLRAYMRHVNSNLAGEVRKSPIFTDEMKDYLIQEIGDTFATMIEDVA